MQTIEDRKEKDKNINGITCQFCRTKIILTNVDSIGDENGMARLRVHFSCDCSAWSGALLRVNVHDASKVVEGPMALPTPSVIHNVRSDLAASIQKYWVGHPTSNIGMQYLRYENGIIEARAGIFARRDLSLIQFLNVCNVFVEPDKSIKIDPWTGNVLNEADRTEIERIVAAEVAKHAEYFEEENRFFQEKPWLQVHGMTPEAAVAKLTELGWGPKN